MKSEWKYTYQRSSGSCYICCKPLRYGRFPRIFGRSVKVCVPQLCVYRKHSFGSQYAAVQKFVEFKLKLQRARDSCQQTLQYRAQYEHLIMRRVRDFVDSHQELDEAQAFSIRYCLLLQSLHIENSARVTQLKRINFPFDRLQSAVELVLTSGTSVNGSWALVSHELQNNISHEIQDSRLLKGWNVGFILEPAALRCFRGVFGTQRPSAVILRLGI